MSSLFARGSPQLQQYSTPPTTDYASFDLPSDDDDEDDYSAAPSHSHHYSTASPSLQAHQGPPPSISEPLHHPLSHSSALSDSSTSASPTQAPPLLPLASSSTSHLDSYQPSLYLPGSYDFEPQPDPTPSAPPPTIPRLTRPVSNSLSSRQPRAPAGAHSDAEDDSYGHARSRDAGGGGLLNWRGLVGRLRGQPAGGENPEQGGRRGDRSEFHGLLFSHDESDDTDTEGRTSYPPPSAQGGGVRSIHLPLPARPPQFAAPVGAAAGAPGGRVCGGGQGNDGVFANLSAKPDNPGGLDVVGEGPDKDEVLPSYNAANLDSTPPYWETTVITPGGPFSADDIIVDGLPVGNFFSFAWNLLVSMSFQFVGFLLTYLLHTTHAAKNGSRAGLGITLIQLGFYLKQRTDGMENAPGDATGLNGAAGPAADERWSWWGGSYPEDAPTATTTALGSLPTQIGAALAGALDASDPDATAAATASPFPSLMGDTGVDSQEMMEMSVQANEWMAFFMITVGSFLLIGGCLSYWRALRWARALRRGQGPGADAENMVSVS
ncbi:hypothetical protein JCM11641_005035 [Rhodosporidiobolus odoratus]